MVNVKINGEKRRVLENMSITELLRFLEIQENEGIAVAVNSNVLSKNSFVETTVLEGDCIEIIHATAGG